MIITVVLASVQIILATVTLVFLVIAIRQGKADAKAETKLLQDILDQTRESSLRIMKALKGGSYAGSFGDIDVHADVSIPRGQYFMYPHKRT